MNGRPGKLEDLVEPTPEGWVQQLLMVGGSDEKARPSKPVQHLKKRCDDSFYLSVFGWIIAGLSERIELVEQQNPRTRARVVEDAVEVGCGLPEIRGDDRIEAHHHQWESHLGGNRLRDA